MHLAWAQTIQGGSLLNDYETNQMFTKANNELHKDLKSQTSKQNPS